MPDNPQIARIRRNLAKMKAANAPQEHIDAYLATERTTPERELAAMPRSAMENVRGGLGSALQGATFNFSDEIVGAGRAALDPNLTYGDAVAEERGQLQDFRKANPKSAFGLELAGGLASGLGAAGAATRGASTAAQAVPRLLASGVGGGAVAGAGAGESAGGRAGMAAGGAALGGILGYGAGKVATSRLGDAAASGARSFREMVDNQTPSVLEMVGGQADEIARAASPAVRATAAPVSDEFGAPALRAAGRALDNVKAPGPQRAGGELIGPRNVLAELERSGMGQDALLMNTGDDLTVRAVRAASNQPGSTAGRTVNTRLAEQGGRLGEQVPRDIANVTGFPDVGPGTMPGEIRVQQMLEQAQDASRPFYEQARALGDIAPERLPAGAQGPVTRFERFVESPLVQREIRRIKQFPEYADLPDTDMRVLDRVYKALGDTQRELANGGRRVEARDMGSVMEEFRSALSERAPVYGQATSAYREGIEPRQAFTEGMDQFRNAAPGGIELSFRNDSPIEGTARRLGISTAMQDAARGKASNADLGDLAQFRDVARAVVGTPAQRDRIVEAFGRENYEQLLATLMPKINAAAQNAAARGNSTTTKQLLDALAFGDDAMLDALTQAGQSGPMSAAKNWVTGQTVGRVNQAMRLGVGKTAGQTADLLTTRGASGIRDVLGMIEQQAAIDAARRSAVTPVAGAAARTLMPSP
jgi:hypothetical protein